VRDFFPLVLRDPRWLVPMDPLDRQAALNVRELEEFRAYVDSHIDAQIDSLILTAFPGYRLEHLEAMSNKELTRLYAYAEWALNNIRHMDLQLVPAE
jgi:hypothetical protein